MPAVAPATAGSSVEEDEEVQWSDQPHEGSKLENKNSDEPVEFSGDGMNAEVRVLSMQRPLDAELRLIHTDDGRLDIHIDERKPSIAGLLSHLQRPASEPGLQRDKQDRIPKTDGKRFPLHLNIVIQVIGSRGDIQPFVALGKELKAHGHRVRLATHLAFREFVLDGGLEFFNIGGDPEELMAFMVKNPGLLPHVSTIRSGAIQKRRREMKQIINGCWRSCYEMGDGTHLHQIKEDLWSDTLDYRRRPFVADAIIANPPSLAHIHCAQRMGIPLHIMFTMPWSPTQSFPHPLAILTPRNCKPTVANFVSYAIVEMMVWEGLGDIINTFRKRTLALDPLDSITAPSLIHRLKIPCSYLWSPAILPKPKDWGDNIDICGFSFLPSNQDYVPPDRIAAFLNAGPTPIYVGFGSIVVDDHVKLTRIVFEAISKAGQRAIVSAGWGNLGADKVEVPDNILVIGSCPHDWLFRQVSCVVHHGGAGTTAAGLALGRPTIIIPFFGDQQFWGKIVGRAGAGPAPIPHRQLTVENLSRAIEMALKPSTGDRAEEIAKKMEKESGVRDGVRSFHRQLDLRSLRCAICQTRPAVWHLRHTVVDLSAFAASVLVETGRVRPEDLVLYRPLEYDTYRNPSGPLSAGAQVFYGAFSNFMLGLADIPTEVFYDILAAGRSLGQPRQHLEPLCKWRKRRSRREKKTESEVGDERTKTSGDSFGDIEDEEETTSNERDEDSETRQHKPRIETQAPPGDLDRTRSVQLEKSESMMSEIERAKSPFAEITHYGGRMSKKLANLVMWLPADLTLSLSKGFHNLPKLYHDPMVTSAPKVIGIRSGLRAACKELRDGFYYGVTGLVTQPRFGYKEAGTKGMLKGVGKGLGGVIFKPPAGLWGIAGYPLTGIRRHLWDSLGRSEQCRIVASRIAQGHEEMEFSSVAERAEVVRKWIIIEESLQKEGPQCRFKYPHPQGKHTNGRATKRER